jgi:FtsP/CotA-like multicopper oxidase with cupredoxin domain
MRLASLASSSLLGILLATFLALPAAADPATTAAAPGGREVRVELVAQYADNVIGNDKVHLRSYNGALVGPTIRARAGDTLNIHLVNRLPANPPTLNNLEVQAAELARELTRGVPPPLTTDIPHNFNTTNLHTHGLHVSPAGNSDNVLIAISPGEEFFYEIKIPPDHPPGTFWYHPHVHGSTALQVSSGMEGALIIEGDIDQVPAIAAAREQIFVFQQIDYATSDNKLNRLEKKGTLEDFNRPFNNGDWANGKRSTLINGALAPVLEMQPGEVQRWRLIDAGVEETVLFKIVGPDGKPVPQQLIALDGITTGRIEAMDQVYLYPGYRADVLIRAPDREGDYQILDEETAGDTAIKSLNKEARKRLGTLRVKGSRKQMALPTQAELEPLAPYKHIEDKEITGQQEVHFGIILTRPGTYPFALNGAAFDPGAAPRKLKLGGVDEWTISSEPIGPHIFHIHINPFEVIEPDGRRYWKDTLFIKSGAKVKVRTRYVRYVGQFVIHCHILPHEDEGMMQLVEIKKR